MKAQVLFDETGVIHAIMHPSSDDKSDKQNRPIATLKPNDKQRSATLEIPREIEHLKPRELHDAVRVEFSGGTPRLVARAK
jgi:hypothetical protein